MGERLCACVLLVAGCAHHVIIDPSLAVGQTHQPYCGKPAYLAANRPLYPEARPDAAASQPCRLRSTACETRLRAELAALDGQLLALAEPPTETELQALALTTESLAPLLAPYPDLQPERDELAQHLAELPTLTVTRRAEARRRMLELSDLLRVQLAASK
jgi:hypothetical protein